MPLSEKRYLAIASIISLIIGLASLLIPVSLTPHTVSDDVVITSYKAVLYPNGTLVEDYVYHVMDSDKRMLYRSWRDPLVARGQRLGKPYIEHLYTACPPGFIEYLYTYDEKLYMPPTGMTHYGKKVLDILRDAGARSETGCYNPHGIPPGDYHVRYVFRLYPPTTCDNTLCLLDLSLASPEGHLYYNKYMVWLRGVDAEKASLLPLTLNAVLETEGNGILVSGHELYKDQGLRIVILSGTRYPATALARQGDPVALYESVLATEKKSMQAASLLALAGGIWGILATPLLLLVYRVYGVERKPIGPIPSGFPPDTGEKPWQVNLLYNGDVGRFTEEVVAATILDLAARGILRVYNSPDGTIITLPSPDETSKLDEYERKLVDALRLLSPDGASLRLEDAKRLARDKRKLLRVYAGSLFNPAPFRKTYKAALETGRKPLVALFLVTAAAGVIVIAVTSTMLPVEDLSFHYKVYMAWLLAVMAYIPPLFMPAYVIGRWRPGYLEKYLAWKKFVEEAKSMLAGPVVGVEGPTAMRIAAYLVALGEERLAGKALNRLGSSLYAAYLAASRLGHHYYTWSGRRGGAGGGGGGGFGGGGAGAR